MSALGDLNDSVPYNGLIERFWSKNGLRFAIDGTPHTCRGRGYRVVQIGNEPGSEIVGVRISSGGRMGNVIIQMVNALFFAKRCGLASVVANKSLIGERGVSIGRDGLTLHSVGSTPPDGLYIEGDFFYPDAMSNGAISPSKAEKYEVSQRFLVPLVRESGLSPIEPDDKELVIHIRSGDIFQPNPHPGYIQPPLGFYITILDDLLENKAIDKVCIVCEDRENPCINALEKRVAEFGLPCHVQSGTLRQDVQRLLAAKHLVFGSGTFGAGICLLTGTVETLHVFGTTIYRDLPNVKRGVIYYADAGYIKDGDWVGSAEQRQLMLDFPPSGLRKEA